MDLGTIERKLVVGELATPEHFAEVRKHTHTHS